MASVAAYGGLTHADNEVNLVMVDYRTRYSPRNRSLTQTRTMHISGELIYPSTSSIVQYANSVFNAYTTARTSHTQWVGSWPMSSGTLGIVFRVCG